VTEAQLRQVLAHHHPELAAGLAEHADEVTRICGRIVEMETTPRRPPVLPADAPQWERDYWRRRAERTGDA
jgi:hypothetical protein